MIEVTNLVRRYGPHVAVDHASFKIEKGEIVAGVIEDITKPQNRIDKTVSRARQIIEQNVNTVQKIAFLLGENAAETEAILNSIIESYTVQDEESPDA